MPAQFHQVGDLTETGPTRLRHWAMTFCTILGMLAYWSMAGETSTAAPARRLTPAPQLPAATTHRHQT